MHRRASLDTFSHVLGMDLNFHLHRKTGELLRIMDRGEAVCPFCKVLLGNRRCCARGLLRIMDRGATSWGSMVLQAACSAGGAWAGWLTN